MQLNKLPVVVWVIVAWSCRTETVSATLSLYEPNTAIIKDIVHIVTSCYGDRISAVGLAGHVTDDLPRRLAQQLIPVVMIDTIRSSTDRVYPVSIKSLYRLPVFIVEAPSSRQLLDLISKRIMYSVWWNPMASFFILDRSYGCENTLDYLKIAWRCNLINAKVLCYHPDYGRVIVTYNPYTSKAPTPWESVLDDVGTYNHPFTLFSRDYRDDESICANLDFEKTNDLGGYPIFVLGRPLGVDVRESFTPSVYEFWSKHERFFSILSRILNTNLVFTNDDDRQGPSNVDMKKLSCLLTARLNGFVTSYPHDQTGLVIISHFRGHKSQLQKIISVIDVDSRIGMGIVYLVTLLFLKFFVRQALVPAFLNLVRITCDSGFANLPENTATRIYMTGLLFFVVTMQGIFQGNLAALLTQQVAVKQVDTIKDLVDFGYKIYGPHYVKKLFEHSESEERFTRVEHPLDCVSYMVNDSSAACLTLGQGMLDFAREHNLHVSDFVEMYYVAFEIVGDWPLQRQIDVILAKFVEADIRETWDVKRNGTKLSDFQIDEEVKKNKDFKNIELRELSFAFVILGIGLLCATIAFIVEWAIQYKCIFVDRQNINWLVQIWPRGIDAL